VVEQLFNQCARQDELLEPLNQLMRTSQMMQMARQGQSEALCDRELALGSRGGGETGDARFWVWNLDDTPPKFNHDRAKSMFLVLGLIKTRADT
jgi:hypothetical protein